MLLHHSGLLFVSHHNQMELLSEVLSDAKGYWGVMVGLEKDYDLTAYQKWTIQI